MSDSDDYITVDIYVRQRDSVGRTIGSVQRSRASHGGHMTAAERQRIADEIAGDALETLSEVRVELVRALNFLTKNRPSIAGAMMGVGADAALGRVISALHRLKSWL